MSYARQLCLFLICCACTVAAPSYAQISSNTLVLFHSMPEIDGTTPPEHAIYLLPGMTRTFTGAKVDQPNGLTLAALETPADPHVLITELIIRANHHIKVIADHGDAAFPPAFSMPWKITEIPDGVVLRWQPGAGMLGQIIGAPPDNRYTLRLEVNHSENPGLDFDAFHKTVYTVTAVPEPSMTVFVAGLIAVGALARRRMQRAQHRGYTTR